jgi:hypothetical protein
VYLISNLLFFIPVITALKLADIGETHWFVPTILTV